MSNHWKILGLEPTSDQRAIKLAYAENIKTVHPEEDPEGFKALQEAYRAALADARQAGSRQSSPMWGVGQDLYDQKSLFSGLSTAEETGEQDANGEPETGLGAIDDETDHNWGNLQDSLVFEPVEDQQEPTEDWSDFSEQFDRLGKMDEVMASVIARLGLINRFDDCLTILRDYQHLTGPGVSYFWHGLGNHLLNMYLFGAWQDRQALAKLFLSHDCQQIADYILAVGLLVGSHQDGLDTTLAEWRRK